MDKLDIGDVVRITDDSFVFSEHLRWQVTWAEDNDSSVFIESISFDIDYDYIYKIHVTKDQIEKVYDFRDFKSQAELVKAVLVGYKLVNFCSGTLHTHSLLTPPTPTPSFPPTPTPAFGPTPTPTPYGTH